MAPPTFAQAIATLTAQQIRDQQLLPALALAGSTVGGAPTSSPDRGMVEAIAAFLAMEQGLRAGVALSISATTALQAGDDWVDAAASWFQVPSNQGPGGTPGGLGRFVATYAVWSVQLAATAQAMPLTLAPGQVVQLQATDANHSIFSLSILAPVTISSATPNPVAMFIARIAGSIAGNVATAQLKAASIITGPAGLSIYQGATPVQTTNAIDQEPSAALLIRCYGRWGTIGAGWTSNAFDYLIPSFAPNVTLWETDNSAPFGPGSMGIWLARNDGPATGPYSTPGTDCALVYGGLTAPGVRRLGAGPIVVQPAATVALSITATTATDGTNPNLVADQTAALNAYAGSIMGPAIIRAETLEALMMGGAFAGPITIAQSPGGPIKNVQINAPGFGGAGAFTVLTFSPALYPGFFQLAAGQILALTLALTTETI